MSIYQFLLTPQTELWQHTVLGVVEWDVTWLFDPVKNRHPHTDTHATKDYGLEKYFLNLRLRHLDEPCPVKDIHEWIPLWYLPDIYTQHWVVSFPFKIFYFTKWMTLPIYEQEGLNIGATILCPDLDQEMKALAAAPWTWWNTGFAAPLGGSCFGEGALNFSPGWFSNFVMWDYTGS
jgi:hypothetical protein